VDWNRLDPDPDQNVHFDADPDPDRHQNDPHADRTTIFTHSENQKSCFIF
jgi:hypothetical protein